MTKRPTSFFRAAALAILTVCVALGAASRDNVRAAGETCTNDQLFAAVDAAGADLRSFSAEAQPKLKQQLAALKEKYKWPDDGYEDRALEHLQDGKIAMFDTQANELLTRIDTLGRPEENPGTDTCAAMNEVKATVSELLAIMRAKAEYISVKVSAELGQQTAAAAPAPQSAPPPPATPALVEAAKAAEKQAADAKPKDAPALQPKAPGSSVVSTVASQKPQASAPNAAPTPTPEKKEQVAKADTQPKPQTPPQAQAAKPSAPVVVPPIPKPEAAPLPPAPPVPQAPTVTAEAEPYPSAEGPYAVPVGEPFPAGSETYGPPPEGPPGENGYSIEEIRDATKGFFGSISTSLASVIEHAFKKSGRPTAYILGNEGGGAFLAGLRYGEGTMYLRNGGTQKVYWHGPSIGSDIGADGSRTLFLVYRLNDPSELYRSFTGIDGTAYLVGGVGLTFLKGGPVVMAPIRSGLGLRFGASLGYLRFTSHKTWNPF